MLVFVLDGFHLRWEAVSSSWLPDKCGSLTQGFAGAASDMALMKAQGPVLKMFSRTLSPCDISVDRNGRTRAPSSVHNR